MTEGIHHIEDYRKTLDHDTFEAEMEEMIQRNLKY